MSITVGGNGSNVGVGLGLSITENDIAMRTAAQILSTDVTAGGGLTMSAESSATIEALAFGASLTVSSSSSGSSVSAQATGAIAINDIDNDAIAEVADPDDLNPTVSLGGPVSITAQNGSLLNDATISATAVAAKLSVSNASSGMSINGSLGAAVAVNKIGLGAETIILGEDDTTNPGPDDPEDIVVGDPDASSITRAAISGVDVSSSAGAATLSATSRADIDAVTVMAGVSVSNSSSGTSVNVSVDASVAVNLTASTVEAVVENGALTVPGTVTLSASDESTIKADIISATISATISSGNSPTVGVSVTASVAVNEINNTTRAVVDNSTVSGASFGAIANSTAAIDVVAVAASVSVSVGGGFTLGGQGTGALAFNTIGNIIEAGAINDAVVTTTGSATISATNAATIDATVVAASANIAASTGSGAAVTLDVVLSIADNDVTTETSALIEDSTLTAGGDLSLTATASGSVNVVGVAASISVAASGSGISAGLSVLVAQATTTVAGSVEAVIRDSLDNASRRSTRASRRTT